MTTMARIDEAKIRIPGTSIAGVRALVVGALAVYVVLFIALNDEQVQLHFVFFRIRSNELLGLAVIAAFSFAAGYIVRGRRQPRADTALDDVASASPSGQSRPQAESRGGDDGTS